MFEIIFYKNTSENEKVTKDLEEILTLSGDLKASTSILSPTILIQSDLSDFTGANYMYIEEWKRYYFITDITSVRNELIEIKARVDVLMSFADEIKANTAIVHRQENTWNLYLNDGTFKVYQNPNVMTMPFPSGFSTREFVLAIAGGSGTIIGGGDTE